MTTITSALTTFAFYETVLKNGVPHNLTIPTVESQAFVAFVDGVKAGEVSEITHGNGAHTMLTIDLGAAATAAAAADGEASTSTSTSTPHTLTLLAEELGYANYGFKTELFKGIVETQGKTINVAGPWKMRGGHVIMRARSTTCRGEREGARERTRTRG